MAGDVISMNTIEFQADLVKFAEQIDADLIVVEKRVALDLFSRIVSRTPVRTGRARASWNISLGSPDEDTRPVGEYPSLQTNPAGVAEEKAGQALGSMTQAEIIWLSNSLPYIEKLNGGSSVQAPANFVEIAVAEVEAEVLSLSE